MSLKKTAAIAVAVGALAAISVPAMAFENEAHGVFMSRFILSSYDNGGTSTLDPTAYRANNKANNYFEQRARLSYIAKASDDLRLVTQFELDTKFGGDKTGKYGISSDAGVLDSDGIMLETKHVYLDFNLGKNVNVKTGIQPIKDSFKGIFLDADATGILVTTKLNPLTISTGYFRVTTDTSLTTTGPTAALVTAATTPVNGTQSTSVVSATSQIGHNNKDIFILDTKFAVTKDVNVGFAYNLLADYTNLANATPTTIHFFGLNADAKIGAATISGFVAAEAGKAGSVGLAGTPGAHKAASGYAANLAFKMPVGPGTLRTAGLFLSGDGNTGNGNNTAFQNTGLATYAESNLWIFARTGAGNTTTDRTITGTAGPGNKGQWLYTVGYDANLTPKIFLNGNLGLSWAAKNIGAPVDKSARSANSSNFQGTELNVETGYKIYDNMTAKVQVAYAILGGYYKGAAADGINGAGKDCENPYTARIAWTYAF